MSVFSAIKKFMSRDKIVMILALVVLAFAMYSYSGSKSLVLDRMTTNDNGRVSANDYLPSNDHLVHSDEILSQPNDDYLVEPGYIQHDVADPASLLPQDENAAWSALNPVGMNQGNVMMPDLLQAGYNIGLDTIGQTLRNPNLQLRSDPIIPKQAVGPWNQSTIEPDLARAPLEVGYGPR